MRRALATALLLVGALGSGGSAQAEICVTDVLCTLDGCTGIVNVCGGRTCSGTVSVCPFAHPNDCHSTVDVCPGLVVADINCSHPVTRLVCDLIPT